MRRGGLPDGVEMPLEGFGWTRRPRPPSAPDPFGGPCRGRGDEHEAICFDRMNCRAAAREGGLGRSFSINLFHFSERFEVLKNTS